MNIAIVFAILIVGIAAAIELDPAQKLDKEALENTSSLFEFALIGDTPYDAGIGAQSKSFDKLVSDINHHHELQWVMFAGDFKNGGAPCSDAMFFDRYKRFNQFDKPFIMTLGDNEWTDCHRVADGEYQPLERQAKLRSIFFKVPGRTLGKHTMQLESQASMPGYESYPENVRWIHNRVLFVTMHIVGSDNAMDKFDSASSAKRGPENDKEVIKRTNADIAWMKSSFALAKEKKVAGIMLMIHGNPGLDFFVYPRDGFKNFIKALDEQIRGFPKPVVLAHGDTHQYTVDRPSLLGDKPPNFVRVETYGATEKHWIEVSVNPDDPKVFRFVSQDVN